MTCSSSYQAKFKIEGVEGGNQIEGTLNKQNEQNKTKATLWQWHVIPLYPTLS